jgi:hypothetical protein
MKVSESLSGQRGIVSKRHKCVIRSAHNTLPDELEAVVVMGNFVLQNIRISDETISGNGVRET